MGPFFFVLGTRDHEMQMIQRLLNQCNQSWHTATAGHMPVHGGTMYTIDPVMAPEGHQLVLVECGWLGQPKDALIIDHHRPGDPGYGKLPDDFLEASSVGQIVNLLARAGLVHHHLPWPAIRASTSGAVAGLFNLRYTTVLGSHKAMYWDVAVQKGLPGRVEWYEVPYEVVYTAAADHCLGHAYRGRCPGVTPTSLLAYRVRVKAEMQNRPSADIQRDIDAAMEAVKAAPTMTIAGVVVSVMGDEYVRELPEAAAYLGRPYLGRGIQTPEGRQKEVLQSAPPDVVAKWMEIHSGSEIYGDPARGFAGRYLPA